MRCAHWRRVPLDLAREAREKSAATYIDRAVQGQLSSHDKGEHFGLLTDAGAYGTALWTSPQPRLPVASATASLCCSASTPRRSAGTRTTRTSRSNELWIKPSRAD